MSWTRVPSKTRRHADAETGGTTMTIDHAHPGSRGLTRRELLKAGGLGLGALALTRPASAQAPKPGGSLISAQTTEATGLDPQLVPALSRSRRSPLMYNQLVRFDPSSTRAAARWIRRSARRSTTARRS